MMDTPFSIFKFILCLFVLNFLLFPAVGFSSVIEETLTGDEKLTEGHIGEAEKHYANALKMDPGNWRVMHSLAKVKFQLKKYKETKQLVDQVLAMKVSKQKIVLVTLKGKSVSFKAELVDEDVVAPEDGSNNMRNYVGVEKA